MKKRLLLCSVAPWLLALFLSISHAIAADPKTLVNEIAKTHQLIEDNTRAEKWTEADAAITTLEKQMTELIAALKPGDAEKFNKQCAMIAEGMHKAVANKSNEEYETPAEALRKEYMELIDMAGYGKPAVFVVMQMQVDEALETNVRGDFAGLGEEMEEIVDMREEARQSAKKAKIDPAKIDAILDLAWDISVDAKEKNQASSQKRLERMKSIIASI